MDCGVLIHLPPFLHGLVLHGSPVNGKCRLHVRVCKCIMTIFFKITFNVSVMEGDAVENRFVLKVCHTVLIS